MDKGAFTDKDEKIIFYNHLCYIIDNLKKKEVDSLNQRYASLTHILYTYYLNP